MMLVLAVVVYLLTGVLVSHWVGLQPVALIRDIQSGKAPSGYYALPSWRIVGGLASVYVITITTWPIACPLWWWSVRCGNERTGSGEVEVKMWQAHAVFEIGMAMGKVPLTLPSPWKLDQATFVPFIDGDYGDPEDDLYMGAIAEPFNGKEAVTFEVRVKAGHEDDTVMVALTQGRTRDPNVLLAKVVDVPMPETDEFAEAASKLTKLAGELAEEVAGKVCEYMMRSQGKQ